jgi:hypothetical protein
VALRFIATRGDFANKEGVSNVCLKRVFEIFVPCFTGKNPRASYRRFAPIESVVPESCSAIIYWHGIWSKWSYGWEVAVAGNHGIMVSDIFGRPGSVGGVTLDSPLSTGPATSRSVCFREPGCLLVYQLSDKQS